MASVFISSTSRDLAYYRTAAIDVCHHLGLAPIAMEHFNAMGMGATGGSKHRLDEADVFVGIVGFRYGYQEDGYDKSVTELEFDYAGERNIERLCFLLHPSLSPSSSDIDNPVALDAFKARIDKTIIRAFVTDVNEFKAALTQALVEWQKRHPQEGKQALHVNIPSVPDLLVGRDSDIERLKVRLGIREAAREPKTVIRGWPGVGKTTILRALVHDKEILQAYPDGVLWANIGQEPDLFQELLRWARALGGSTDKIETLAAAQEMVRTLLHNKRAVLIVDDVWNCNDWSWFDVAGPRCVTLITTRLKDIATCIGATPDNVYVLGTLTDEQGFFLLSKISPTVTATYPDESLQLVSDLEGLPLALRVAGRMLENDASAGIDVQETFQEVRQSVLDGVSPDDRFDPISGTTPSIALVLRKSTDRLDEFTRDCYAFLGEFAPKPATFDLAAMSGVWQVAAKQTIDIVRVLTDRGLLEYIGDINRYWMHAVLVMHAKTLLTD
jgi:hypothetical protein